MSNETFLLKETRSYLSDVSSILERVPVEDLVRIVSRLEEARWNDQAVFTCGNGGSAATAIHFACDLAKGASAPGKPNIKALSLCENVSLLTAWANDVSYDDVFARRMAPWLKKGDVLVAISGSGNSRNVLNAIYRARAGYATTIGFAGFDGGKMKDLVDLCIVVPSNHIEHVEDVHLLLCHLVTVCLRGLPTASADLMRSRGGKI